MSDDIYDLSQGWATRQHDRWPIVSNYESWLRRKEHGDGRRNCRVPGDLRFHGRDDARLGLVRLGQAVGQNFAGGLLVTTACRYRSHNAVDITIPAPKAIGA